jgi:hypothetical protein
MFCLFSFLPAQANVNLVIIDETQNYEGIGIDLTNGAKARLSRMGYIILNNSQKLNVLGLTADRFARDRLLQRETIRLASDELIIIFLDTIISNKKIRVSAEAYSTAAQAFIHSWSLPSENLYSPPGCDAACLRINNDHLISGMAEEIGDVIGRLLTRETGITDNKGQTIAAIEVELIDFTDEEKLQLIDLMTHEFPDFYRVSKTRIYGPRHTLTYHSSANMLDLHKWMVVSLKQIGLNPTEDVDLTVSAGRIDIRKTNIMIRPQTRGGNSARFN